MRKSTRAVLHRELQGLCDREEFPCSLTEGLNKSVVTDFLPHAKSEGTWARKGSWLGKFFKFARDVCRKSAQLRSDDECLRSNVMCRHFITHVAGQQRGVTRPRSARMVLSAARAKLGAPSLSDDPMISAVVDGTEASNPRTKKQSPGLTDTMVKCVRQGWGKSRKWHRNQIALIMALGFVSLMRLGEIRKLHYEGVRVVFDDGSECLLRDLKELPRNDSIKGALFHLPWRKNHKYLDCWVPVACAITIDLLFHHLQLRSAQKCRSPFLFPARRGAVMHHANPVGHQSVVTAMRHALCACVPLMSHQWAKLYTGHAMRVGGSNHMRKIGVADEVHRRLGGWMTLVAAQGYMAMSAREQMAYTLKLTSTPRESAFHKRDAVAALSAPNLRGLLA